MPGLQNALLRQLPPGQADLVLIDERLRKPRQGASPSCKEIAGLSAGASEVPTGGLILDDTRNGNSDLDDRLRKHYAQPNLFI